MILVYVSIALFSNLVDAAFVCPNITVHWWEIRPYIYPDENKNPSGIIPLILKSANNLCKSGKFHIKWLQNESDYANAVLEIGKPKSSSPTNGSIDIWLPFSQLNFAPEVKELPILESNLVFMLKIETKMDKLINVFKGFKRILPQILLTLLLTIFFGILMWIAETRSNNQFPKPFPRGAWHGFWWAIVTVTTVGYGDKSPRTGPGRFIAIVWMVTGLVLFPVLTAEVTLILTDTSYSLSLKKVGALKGSHEMKLAIDQGAFGRECNSYNHCFHMLSNGTIEVMLANVHVATELQRTHYLVKKGSIAAKIPISAFVREVDESVLKSLFRGISTSSNLITESLITLHENQQWTDSKGVIFSSGTTQFVIVLFAFVVGIYFIVFLADCIIRHKQRKTKIGDFHEGVIMENVIIKDGSQHTHGDFENPRDAVIMLIKRQKMQLIDMQTRLDEMENKLFI